jgi:hypothetical protein
MSLDVAADGAFTGRYLSCSLKGNLRVGDGGLYTVSAAYEPGPCANSGLPPFEGVALIYPLATGGRQMVFAVTTNNGVDSNNIVALGLRPPLVAQGAIPP